MRRCLFAVWILSIGLAVSPALAVTFVVDSADESYDADSGDGLCLDDSGHCTLRAAIDQANALPGKDLIQFDLPAPASPIQLIDALWIQGALEIDGYTQPGASRNTLANGTNAVLPIVLDGTSSSQSVGIAVSAPDVSLSGIELIGRGGFFTGIDVGYGGSDASRFSLQGSRISRCTTGVQIAGSANVRIGNLPSLGLGKRNHFFDNGIAIDDLGTTSYIVNNLIGTDASGTAPGPETIGADGIGIQLERSGASVTDNVISANDVGVLIAKVSSNPVSNIHLLRNRIGTTADGSAALGNRVGVMTMVGTVGGSTSGNHIGLTLADANVISGNDVGIQLGGQQPTFSTESGDLVQGNYIGTGAGGVGAIPNRVGIAIAQSSRNTIGSAAGQDPALYGNVIAHNRPTGGIVIHPDPTLFFTPLDNTIRGNRSFDNAFDIDLAADGVITDGVFHLDVGPNYMQNAPRIQSVTQSQGQTRIQGEIATSFGQYTLDFYASSACDPPADTGSGEFLLGSASFSVPTNSNTPWPFDVTLPVTAPRNAFSALATKASGSTSEFGPCYDTGGVGADLVPTLDPLAPSFVPGDPIAVRVTLQNLGPQPATGVPVQLVRPAAIASWSGSASQGSFDEATDLWSAGDLASGESATLDLSGEIAAGAAGAANVEVRVDPPLAQVDSHPESNVALRGFEVRTGAHLEVVQTPALIGAAPGTSVDFHIEVRNSGPQTAQDVVLEGLLDLDLEVDASNGPAGIVVDPIVLEGWSLALGDIAAEETVPVDVRLRVSPTADLPSGLKHTVIAIAASPDDATSQPATAVVGVPIVADLTIAEVTPLAHDTWHVVVANNGPDPVGSYAITTPRFDEGEEHSQPLPAALDFDGPSGEGVGFWARVIPSTSEPYYDPNPDNDRKNGYSPSPLTGRQCGLLGIEAPLTLGLFALVRGARGRRAMRRLLRGGALALLLAAPLGVTPGRASATPLTLAVDSAASSATFTLATPLGTPAPVASTLSGSVLANLDLAISPLFGAYVSKVDLNGGSLAFSNVSFPLESFPLYSLSFATSALAATPAGPATGGFAVGAGLSVFDLFGSSLAFDTGVPSVSGTYFGTPVLETLDLASLPFTSYFPLGSTAQAQLADLGGGLSSVELRIPYSTMLHLSLDGEDNALTVAGTAVLRGSIASVPEPGTVLFVGLGLAVLAASRRSTR